MRYLSAWWVVIYNIACFWTLPFASHVFGLLSACLPARNKSLAAFTPAACILTWQRDNTNNSDVLDFSSGCPMNARHHTAVLRSCHATRPVCHFRRPYLAPALEMWRPWQNHFPFLFSLVVAVLWLLSESCTWMEAEMLYVYTVHYDA